MANFGGFEASVAGEADPGLLALKEQLQSQIGQQESPVGIGSSVATTNSSLPSGIPSAANSAVQSSAPPYKPILSDNELNDINNRMYGNVDNPVVPNQATFNYTPLQQQQGEDLQTRNAPNVTPYNVSQASAPNAEAGQASAPNAEASQAQTTDVNAPNKTAAQRYDATLGKSPEIADEYAKLTKGVTEGEVPDWARTAVTAARQRTNSMGLGNSTMALNATAAAVLNAAQPLALAQLSVDQQTMLSNQAADNAAKQFNATSQQQNDQFFTSLATQVATQNADRRATIDQFNAAQRTQVGEFNVNTQSTLSQFNAAQKTQVGEFNVNTQATLSQFNAQQNNAAEQFIKSLNNQVNEFNTQNQLLVDQSNVQWRRTINTVNTAGVNATNAANVQNLFNVSQSSLNNIWQEARDEASWALTSGENAKNRELSLVNSSLNRQTSLDIMNSQMQAQLYSSLGSFATNVLGGLFGGSGAQGIGQGIGNLIGGVSDLFSGGGQGSSGINDIFSSFGENVGTFDFGG